VPNVYCNIDMDHNIDTPCWSEIFSWGFKWRSPVAELLMRRRYPPSFRGTDRCGGFWDELDIQTTLSSKRFVLRHSQGDLLLFPTFIFSHQTGWWFQRFILTPIPRGGEMIQFDGCIFFETGWFNHQLDKDFLPLMVQKSGVHQLRLVGYPIVDRVFIHPNGGWPWDFLNHRQNH